VFVLQAIAISCVKIQVYLGTKIAYLFVKLPRPGGSEGIFSVFESKLSPFRSSSLSCHQVLASDH